MSKFILFFMSVLLVASFAQAADKVVVIPLNSKRTTCSAPDEVLSVGQCWKDRNLGASRVATSVNDSLAYGDLYQWGRSGRGHQNRNSAITDVNSAYDNPGHNLFITEASTPYDWRNPQNDNLWQGIGAINNPCPQGFRIPTEEEWEKERASWEGNNNSTGAYASPLKLVAGGYRYFSTGTISGVTSYGDYWSSSTNGIYARRMTFSSIGAGMVSESRANGASIRCIKN